MASALLGAALLLYVGLRSRWRLRILDDPRKPQSMHAEPVPRFGGLGMVMAVSGVLVGVSRLATLDRPLCALLLIVLGLAALSLIDDLRGLPVWLRLFGQALAATLALQVLLSAMATAPLPNSHVYVWLTSSGGTITLLLTIIWVTNLFNFMDGANGNLGISAAIGFGCLALIALEGGGSASGSLAIVCAALTGAVLGFLVFNFPVARVFAGDAGSIPLGFLAATLGIYGNLLQAWPYWFPLLVFSPIIADATFTIARRAIAGHRPWVAHRDHYYQRLILSGWTHTRTAVVYGAAALLAAGIAFALTQYNRQQSAVESINGLAVLCIAVVTYASIAGVLERHLQQKMNDPRTQEKRNQGLK